MTCFNRYRRVVAVAHGTVPVRQFPANRSAASGDECDAFDMLLFRLLDQNA